MAKSAYLLIAHGTRKRQGNVQFHQFVEAFQKAFPERIVEGAFLDILSPSIPQGIEKCIRRGAGEIFILPLMFFSGRHAKDDVPRFIQEAKAKHLEIDFHYAGPIHDHPLMFRILEDKARTAAKKKRVLRKKKSSRDE